MQIVEIFYKNNGSVGQTYRALRPYFGSHIRTSERLIPAEQAVAAVQQSIEEDPHQSIRHGLRKDVVLRSFKIQLILELMLNDHRMRRQFGQGAEAQIDINFDSPYKILFIDEVHFWLNGYVNTQNGPICSENTSQAFAQIALNPQKITIGCALWAAESLAIMLLPTVNGIEKG